MRVSSVRYILLVSRECFGVFNTESCMYMKFLDANVIVCLMRWVGPMLLNVHDDKPSSMKGKFQRFSEVLQCFGVATFYRRWTCSCCLCVLEFGFSTGKSRRFRGRRHAMKGLSAHCCPKLTLITSVLCKFTFSKESLCRVTSNRWDFVWDDFTPKNTRIHQR